MTSTQASGSFVTGGARGLGLAISERLARRGDVVFLADIDGEAAAQAASGLAREGRAAHPITLDVADPEAVAEAVAAADRVAPLATVVNNAGVAWTCPLVETTPERFDSLMATNVRGSFFVLQAAARAMIPRRQGCIVNVASTSAFTASTTPMVAYDTSKGAIRMLTAAAARELAAYGIRVNAVAPGTVATDLTRSLTYEPGGLERLAETRIPLGRLGRGEDVAAAVAFLSSAEAAYVTGHVLVVDGGWLA
ncbi:MAG: SDR family oxidoreductase [Actinobacteria bacterium]|nr:SDR family oxidoreductase [Actinomycetota bacterium]